MEWLTAKYSSVWVYWDMHYSVKLKIHRMRKGSKLANKNSLSFLNSQCCNHGAFLDWTDFLCIILQRTSQIYHLDNVLLISFFLPFPSCYSNIFLKISMIPDHLHTPHSSNPFTSPSLHFHHSSLRSQLSIFKQTSQHINQFTLHNSITYSSPIGIPFLAIFF